LLSRLIQKMLEKGKLQKVAEPYLSYFQREYQEQYLPQLREIYSYQQKNSYVRE
jgi:hypothetical protein